MKRGKNKGFTIVEITLFVAISGLLILTAMLTISGKQQQVQFTDSMRGFQSFVETQVSAAINGVNDNPVDTTNCSASTGGNSGDCVVLGRALVLTDGSSTVEYYNMTGNRLNADDEGSCPPNLFQCSEPKLETPAREYNISWGTTFDLSRSRHTVASAEQSRAFAFARNSRSTSITSLTYSDVGSPTNLIQDETQYGIVSPQTIAQGDEVDAFYCFRSSDDSRQAAITINSSNVNLVFDHPNCG